MQVEGPAVLAVGVPHHPKQALTSQLQPHLVAVAVAVAAAPVMAAAAAVQQAAHHQLQR
jgi:hypothetical protein